MSRIRDVVTEATAGQAAAAHRARAAAEELAERHTAEQEQLRQRHEAELLALEGIAPFPGGRRTRIRRRYRFEAGGKDGDGTPRFFTLRVTETGQVEDKRHAGGWAPAGTSRSYDLTEALSRAQVAEIVADGASALADLDG